MKATDFLDLAEAYAQKRSGCRKVKVGSVIVDPDTGRIISMGANRCIPDLCTTVRGCLRTERYGEDSRSHRNPEDCRALHSEVDAVVNAATSLKGAEVYVTRYPCEACARVLIAAGVRRVFYGGTAQVSNQTLDMFETNDIQCVFVPNWRADNSER